MQSPATGVESNHSPTVVSATNGQDVAAYRRKNARTCRAKRGRVGMAGGMSGWLVREGVEPSHAALGRRSGLLRRTRLGDPFTGPRNPVTITPSASACAFRPLSDTALEEPPGDRACFGGTRRARVMPCYRQGGGLWGEKSLFDSVGAIQVVVARNFATNKANVQPVNCACCHGLHGSVTE